MSLPLARRLIQLRTTSISSIRSFSTVPRQMAEGDTGAPRSGGAAQSDAFTKREQASEDYAIRQREQQKLEELKKRIADKEAEIAKDREEAEKIVKKQS